MTIGSAELLIITLGSLLVSSFLVWLAAKITRVTDATFGRALVVGLLGLAMGLVASLLGVRMPIPPLVAVILGIAVSVALIRIVFRTTVGKAVATWFLAAVGHGVLAFAVAAGMLGSLGLSSGHFSPVSRLASVLGNRPSWSREPVCTVLGSQRQPTVYKERVAYADHRGSDFDIYLYDMQTGEEKLVCGGPGNQTSPDLWGDSLVWIDDRNGTPTVWWRDLASGTERPVHPTGSPQSSPSVWGDYVAWEEVDCIFVCDLSSGAVEGWAGFAPCVGARGVVREYREGSNSEVRFASYSNGPSEDLLSQDAALTHRPTATSSRPNIRGSAVAFEYKANAYDDSDIGIYDLDRQRLRVVERRGEQRKPILGEGIVVFMDRPSGSTWRLCRHDLATGKTYVIREDCDESDSYDVSGTTVVYTEPEPGGVGQDIWVSRPLESATPEAGWLSQSLRNLTSALSEQKGRAPSTELHIGEQLDGRRIEQLPYDGTIIVRSSDLERIKQYGGLQHNERWRGDSPLGLVAYLMMFYIDSDLQEVTIVPGWVQTTSALENREDYPYRFAIEATTFDDDEGRNLPYIETVMLQHADMIAMSEAYAFYGFCTAVEGPERIDRPYVGLTDEFDASPNFRTRVEVLDSRLSSYQGRDYIDEIRLRVRIEAK